MAVSDRGSAAVGFQARRDAGRITLGNSLLLVEYTGRLLRDAKASISAEMTSVFERLGSTAETWQARLMKLSGGRMLGRFLASSRGRLREAAAQLGVHHLANVGGCAAVLNSGGLEQNSRFDISVHQATQYIAVRVKASGFFSQLRNS